MSVIELVTNLFKSYLSSSVANGTIIKWKQDRDLLLIQPTAANETVKVSILLDSPKPDQSNLILRKLVWLSHECYYPFLYGDDGEMQCNHCMIDFKRDSAESIEDKLEQIHMKKIQEEVKAAGGFDEWRRKVFEGTK